MDSKSKALRHRLLKKAIRFTVEIQNRAGWDLATGIILDKNGHILTNWHVVYDQGKKCQVGRYTLNKIDKPKLISRHLADVMALNEELDVAVVKLCQPPKDLVPAPLGDSSTLTIGTPLLRLWLEEPYMMDSGHLFRFIKKGQRRSFEVSLYAPYGSSGGPFLDHHGRVMGIELEEGGTDHQYLAPSECALEINAVKEYLLRLEDDDNQKIVLSDD